MSRTPDGKLADPEQIIANLNRQLAKRQAELDQRIAERDALQRELVDAGQQQTATADVLRVINSSPGELAPVFGAVLDKALTLCGAAFGVLWRFDGGLVRAAAIRGATPAYTDFLTRGAYRPDAGSANGRLLTGASIVHQADIADTEDYRSGNELPRAIVELGGGRTLLAVALRREATFLGSIVIYRREVRPFADKQIALLQSFAAQAVIAMESARLLTETREALEQQTATAEVLHVINSSPGDLAPVFNAMLERAMRLCEGSFAQLDIFDGERFQTAAMRNVPRRLAEFRTQSPPRYGPDTIPARLIGGELVVHVPDLKAESAYLGGEPNRRAVVDLGGARAALAVPLRKDNALVGEFTIYRREARPFTDKQIALLQNFAAQAVIAIENARLINETREALEQQTATAEVLQVINSSPGDLAPVFDAMLDKAMRLCGAAFGFMTVIDSERSRTVAARGVPAAYAAFRERNPTPANAPISSRLRKREPFIHTVDLKAERFYEEGDPQRRAIVDLGGARTLLAVSLMRDQAVLGAIQVYRTEVRPFADKQIALLQNFAAQPVIAMENARLITETREALDRQIATAEVLQIINSSPGDLAPVFDTILEKAHSLCGSGGGALVLSDGERFRAVAVHGLTSQFAEFARRPFRANPITQRLRQGERVVHIPDVAAMASQWDHRVVDAHLQAGTRTILAVPLRKDEALLGYISAARPEVSAFADREISLLEHFAAQAVIAMDNARLLNEIRQRQAELRVTFDNMGDGVVMFDSELRLAAWNRNFQELLELPETFLAGAAKLC
jgi:GAF domain-containing protein